MQSANPSMDSSHQVLTDDMLGSFAVRTASGTLYAIHLDSPREVVRLAKDQAPTPRYSHLQAAELRRDGEAIKLVRVIAMQVGRPGLMLLDVRRDGVLTVRSTTRVVSITRLQKEMA